MTKRPPPGKCIHCLKEFDILTWDHVLPHSWYPDGFNNFEKWDAPACSSCNRELGKVEQDLLTKLGLCLDPAELKSFGIPDRVLRSLNPSAGKNKQDSSHRFNKRIKILREIKMLPELPKHRIFPNFGPIPGLNYDKFPVIYINSEEVNIVIEKIVRGIVYIADKSFIDNSFKFELIAADEDQSNEMQKLVDEKWQIFNPGAGFQVKRLLIEQNHFAGIYFIDIWGRFRCFMVVSPKYKNDY
jgi:hypothetical protein